MADKASPPSLPKGSHIIESNGKELRMSYGMFNDIMRIVGNTPDASTIMITDPMARDLVIRRLFTDNNKTIDKTEDLIDPFDIEVLPSELDGILAWVADHVSHFFVSTGRTMQGVLEKYQNQLPKADPEKENQSSE